MKYLTMAITSILVFAIAGSNNDTKDDTSVTDTAVEVEDSESSDSGTEESADL